jgi:acyl-CoA thioesterase FadM
MARLNLQFPEDAFVYRTTLTVRITDINAANHLSNDAMISMISEARARFLYAFGITEPTDAQLGIIVTDLATSSSASRGRPTAR